MTLAIQLCTYNFVIDCMNTLDRPDTKQKRRQADVAVAAVAVDEGATGGDFSFFRLQWPTQRFVRPLLLICTFRPSLAPQRTPLESLPFAVPQ